eukprot:754616-Hanusia_phi.AAC.1
MAQRFVGSNNLPLLYPSGQFGTRLQVILGSFLLFLASPFLSSRLDEDMAGRRGRGKPEIHLHLPQQLHTLDLPRGRRPFADLAVRGWSGDRAPDICPHHPHDADQWSPGMMEIRRREKRGKRKAGSEGSGGRDWCWRRSSWSTSIPCYNPFEIIRILKSLILGRNGEKGREEDTGKGQELTPWYAGFKGKIEKHDEEGKFVCSGCFVLERKKPLRIRVTELPIGMWTESFQEHLNRLSERSEEKTAVISSYSPNNSEAAVDTSITFTDEARMELMENGVLNEGALMKLLKLTNLISLNNMILFAPDGKIKQYFHPVDIIADYFPQRMRLYELRKKMQEARLSAQSMRLTNQVKRGLLLIHLLLLLLLLLLFTSSFPILIRLHRRRRAPCLSSSFCSLLLFKLLLPAPFHAVVCICNCSCFSLNFDCSFLDQYRFLSAVANGEFKFERKTKQELVKELQDKARHGQRLRRAGGRRGSAARGSSARVCASCIAAAYTDDAGRRMGRRRAATGLVAFSLLRHIHSGEQVFVSPADAVVERNEGEEREAEEAGDSKTGGTSLLTFFLTQLEQVEAELKRLKDISPEDIWLAELEALETKLKAVMEA